MVDVITPPILLPIHLLGTVMQGPAGQSAYQLAVSQGFQGDLAAWLEYIRAKNVELRNNGSYIQWRREDGAWANLIILTSLKGEKGDSIKGDQGDPGPYTAVTAGTVTTLPSGSPAAVTTSTTSPGNIALNFAVPVGPQGAIGNTGDKGERAWTPVISIVADGDRRVQAVDWANGSGMKPVTGYLGPQGVTSDISEAADVRGPVGAAGTGTGDMVAANNLSEVDPAQARWNIQAAHEGGNANFQTVNLGTGGASLMSDNEGSLLVHAGSPALGEAFYDFDKSGNLHTYQGSFFTKDGEVWHPGNFDPASKAPLQHSHAEATTSVAGFMSAADKIKLANIAAGATANQTDAYLLNRQNHTGSQAQSTITGLVGALGAKLNTNNPTYTGVFSGPNIAIRDVPGTYRSLKFFSNAQQRWGFLIDPSPEGGTAAGSDFYFTGHDNNEAQWTVFSVQRSTRYMNIYSPLVMSGATRATQGVEIGNGANMKRFYQDGANIGLQVNNSFWSFNDSNGTFVSNAVRLSSGRLFLGSTETESLFYVNGTLYLENNRNFSLGSGRMYAGVLELTGSLELRGAASAHKSSIVYAGNNLRWQTVVGPDSEGGDWYVQAHADNGAFRDVVLRLNRANSAATFSGTVTAPNFTQPSDERLKENWREAAPAGWTRKLPRIKHGLFDLKDGTKDMIGVGAQGLARLLPAAVTHVKGQYRKVSYATAAMLGVIDLAQRVNELEDRLAKLEKRA